MTIKQLWVIGMVLAVIGLWPIRQLPAGEDTEYNPVETRKRPAKVQNGETASSSKAPAKKCDCCKCSKPVDDEDSPGDDAGPRPKNTRSVTVEEAEEEAGITLTAANKVGPKPQPRPVCYWKEKLVLIDEYYEWRWIGYWQLFRIRVYDRTWVKYCNRKTQDAEL